MLGASTWCTKIDLVNSIFNVIPFVKLLTFCGESFLTIFLRMIWSDCTTESHIHNMNDDVVKTKRKTLLQMLSLAFEYLMLPSSIRVLVWNINGSCYLWLFNCYWLSNISQLEECIISLGHNNDIYFISNFKYFVIRNEQRFLRYILEKWWPRVRYGL